MILVSSGIVVLLISCQFHIWFDSQIFKIKLRMPPQLEVANFQFSLWHFLGKYNIRIIKIAWKMSYLRNAGENVPRRKGTQDFSWVRFLYHKYWVRFLLGMFSPDTLSPLLSLNQSHLWNGDIFYSRFYLGFMLGISVMPRTVSNLKRTR